MTAKPDRSEAEMSFAVANSPLFLLRKLRSDPAVKRFADSTSTSEIVSRIKAALAVDPVTVGDSVEPYFLLVSLWFKRDPKAIRNMTTFKTDKFPWFQYVATVLNDDLVPEIVVNIGGPKPVVDIQQTAGVGSLFSDRRS